MASIFSLLRQNSEKSVVTIAVGANVTSETVLTNGARGASAEMPSATYAAWTAANLALEVSDDLSTWLPIKDELGNRVMVTVNGAGVYTFKGSAWPIGTYKYVRLASVNSSGVAVNQTGGSTRLLAISLLR